MKPRDISLLSEIDDGIRDFRRPSVRNVGGACCSEGMSKGANGITDLISEAELSAGMRQLEAALVTVAFVRR